MAPKRNGKVCGCGYFRTLSIHRFGVCRSSDLSIHVRRIFPRTNALLQPSLGAMTALPMTGFHREQISLHGKQYFRNTATFGILPCLLAISDSRGAVNIRQIRSVSGILTRFPCSANKNACPIIRVAHLPQKPCYSVVCKVSLWTATRVLSIFQHIKRPLLPCYLADKRSLVFSVYSV